MLTPHKIRVGPGARQMSNQGVKQCQANEGADSKAGNDVQCARGHRTASPGRCRSLREILKVSDDKVTHHFHQKGAFGLNGELHFTPKRHPEDSRTVIRLTKIAVSGVSGVVRFETGHVNAWSCPRNVSGPVRKMSGPVRNVSGDAVRSCPERVSGMSGNVR